MAICPVCPYCSEHLAVRIEPMTATDPAEGEVVPVRAYCCNNCGRAPAVEPDARAKLRKLVEERQRQRGG